MSMKFVGRVLAASAAMALPLAFAPAQAVTGGQVQSGSYGNLNWTAQSMLVGTGPTNAGHGETINTGSMPAFSGTVGLLMGGFVCSGTLLADRMTILTAGHCVSSGGGTPDYADDAVTVFFRNPGSGPDVQFYYGGPGYTTVQSNGIFVNSQYTGDVIDQNDIALVRLSQAAPVFAESYQLYTGDLTGQQMTVTGYGSTSSIGGQVGVNTANPNRLGWFRQGTNNYDFALGDDLFGTTWSDILGEPFSQIEYSYISDFDNGLAANDASCRITQASNFGGLPGTTFCGLGTGEGEVGVAGGDSGGGSFINGQVASVNSYGLTFGTSWGDVDGNLNSSYGEFSGYVPVWLHADWINSLLVPTAAVPEPSTWLMMIGGFAFVGGSMRRRKAAVSFA